MAKKIFLIAGEPSGDALGARLIQALKAQSTEPVEFKGIGGPKMQAQGFKSLLPMDDLCVMGIWEVIWQLPRLLKIINGLVHEIEKFDPHALVTIDLPDLNFQVASRIKKRAKTKAKLIHYVAPSVWAWRAKRADHISKFLDGLICLLPFEPAYFPKLNAVYAGHPLVENNYEGNAEKFRQSRGIEEGVKTLGVLFGSRQGEIKAHKELLKSIIELIAEIHPGLHVIAPTVSGVEFEVLQTLAEVDVASSTVSGIDIKWDAFAACDVAVAVSGTVGLELAFANVPHVIVYKTSPVTWAAMKMLVKVKYAHLVNILLDRVVIPEYLQGRARPMVVGKALLKLYKVEDERAKQTEAMPELHKILGEGETPPSIKAADFVLSVINSTKPFVPKPVVKPAPKPKAVVKKPEVKVATAPVAEPASVQEKKSFELPFQLPGELQRLVDLVISLIPKKK